MELSGKELPTQWNTKLLKQLIGCILIKDYFPYVSY